MFKIPEAILLYLRYSLINQVSRDLVNRGLDTYNKLLPLFTLSQLSPSTWYLLSLPPVRRAGLVTIPSASMSASPVYKSISGTTLRHCKIQTQIHNSV